MPNENKKIVQDVVPPRRSIRDVAMPSRSKGQTSSSSKMPEEKPKMRADIQPSKKAPIGASMPAASAIPPRPTPPEIEPSYPRDEVIPETIGVPSYTYEYDEPSKRSKTGLYIAIGLFVIASAFGVSALFKSATVKFTPRHETRTLSNAVFTAKKDETGNALGFQIVTTSKSVEKKVTATGESKVTTKATGKVVLFNAFSATPQKLIATTRLQTPEGLVFRIPTAVSIPGKQTVAGKVVPGSVEVTVVADSVGPAYNIGLKDFTVPGFKGDPRYSQVYARSKTPMTGGFDGMQKSIDLAVLSAADLELEATLKDTLGKDIVSQIPTNFILYTESMTTIFGPSTQTDGGDGTALIKKKGTAYAIIFDKGSLSRAVLAQAMASTSGDTINTTNLEKLTFAYPDGKAFDPSSTNISLTFTLSGDAEFVWTLDENKLKSDLLGLSKTQATQVLKGYPAIQEAWVVTSPFWNTVIPKNDGKVTLINTRAL